MFFSDVRSRTRILYKSLHAGNHDSVVVFKCPILVHGFSFKSAHIGHAYDFFKAHTTTNVHSRTRILYKSSHAILSIWKTIMNLLPEAPGPDPYNLPSIFYQQNKEFAPGSSGAGC